MLAIVIPTITGREGYYDRCYRAYCSTLLGWPFEIFTVKDEKNWPTAANAGTELALAYQGISHIHYTADDLIPHDGWYRGVLSLDPETMQLHSVTGSLPAPIVYRAETGRRENESDGPPGATCEFPRIPLLTREQAIALHPWPDMDYLADVWLGHAARARLNLDCRVVGTYEFSHWWSQIGRLDTPERMEESERRYRAALELL